MLKLMSVLALCAAHAASELQSPAEWAGRPSVITEVGHKSLAREGDLPLVFVPNAGQIAPAVRFYAQTAGAAFYFTRTEVALVFARGEQGHALRLTFPGANPAPRIVARTPATGRINSLIGAAADWRTALPAYGEVIYRELWPGIDLAFRGGNGALKYEFHVAPGANVGDIRLAYRSAERLSLDVTGDLRIHTALGVLRDNRPESYQTVGGHRVPVASRYALADGGYHFVLGAYNPTLPLVIDPGLEYSTYLGGGGSEQGLAIAVDSSGDAYITGRIFQSANFPTTTGAFDTTLGGAGDAFVTKLDPTGALVYSTYLGGSGDDAGHGIAVDSIGRAYIVGTAGTGFPTTVGAFDTTGSGFFVTRLNAFGTALEYSTYLGDGALLGVDIAAFRPHIAVDDLGSAYVTGIASANFPTTAGAFDVTPNGNNDVFVTKLNPSGSALEYSTYLGGNSNNWGSGIAVDRVGSAYVTGLTTSVNFPTTPGVFDPTFNGDRDAFVTKLSPSGGELVYSTYLGGVGIDVGVGIAVDRLGNAYVTGATTSGLSTRSCEAGCFPTTPGAFDRILGGSQDAFVTKLNASGTALVYSTFLGASRVGVGTAFDHGTAIAVDDAGAAYVTGIANGPDFPLTADAIDTTVGPSVNDAFLTKVDPAGSTILYSTYLGGSDEDTGTGIAVDGLGPAYIVGTTQSLDFPVTPGAVGTSRTGSTDAFIARMSIESVTVPTTLALTSASFNNLVGALQTLTATVRDANGQPVGAVIVRFAAAGAVTTSGECTTDSTGTCDFSYQGPTVPGSVAVAAFADTDRDNIQDSGEPFASATHMWVVGPPATVALTPTADAKPVSSQHCVTAIVADAFGNLVSGAIVRFTIAGAINTSAAITTDGNGQAVFCYVGPDFPGADDIAVHVDSDGDGVVDSGEPIGSATTTWLLPHATAGQVTGGGQALASDGAAEIAFGFNAKSDDSRLNGHCNVVDQAAGIHLKCVDVTSLVRAGTHATIFGNASINGSGTAYRIDVDDVDEPGSGRDIFRITTSTGYAAGGVLARGNIQVR